MNCCRRLSMLLACTVVAMLLVVLPPLPAAGEDAGDITGPAAESRLTLDAPIDLWDEAVPLGNGLMGGLLWGNDQVIRLSLDRGDLWDCRTPKPFLSENHTWAKLVEYEREEKYHQALHQFGAPYSAIPYQTKLPGGRVEFSAKPALKPERFHLDPRRALATIDFEGGKQGKAFYSAVQPVGLLWLPASEVQVKLIPPAAVKQLGYPPAEQGSEPLPLGNRSGKLTWMRQEAAEGLAYTAAVGTCPADGGTLIAVAMPSTNDSDEPIALARTFVAGALMRGFDAAQQEHEQWWAEFWKPSGVRLPEPDMQLHYDLVQYFYGAASRRGAPPIPLQGVWTADEGKLPPWRGDYHHDMNTQNCYAAYQAAGRFDAGLSFLEFMWDLVPRFHRYAVEFFGTPGIQIPGIMALDGGPMGGWRQYSCSASNGAWIGHLFYLHWKYTQDETFLREKGYPFCRELAKSLEVTMRPGPDGKLKLPLSSSPEVHNNAPNAWLTPNSNYDLMLIRALFEVTAEMADQLGREDEAAHWRQRLAQMDDFAYDEETGLMISPDERATFSHRHPSHVMAIWPLGTLTIEQGDRQRTMIETTLNEFRKRGWGAWVGYTFPWSACLHARAGQSEPALKHLKIYLEAFILRNGFHCNGDYKQLGYIGAKYRPFTLEGNFLFSQAVHELLLQTWGGVVRIFPTVPEEWKDVRFQTLRGEGGWIVSAERRDGQTTLVRIEATVDGKLTLRNPFGEIEGKPTFNRNDVKRVGQNWEVHLKAGDVLEARR